MPGLSELTLRRPISVGVGAYLSDMSRDQEIADAVAKTMLGYKKCSKCGDLFDPAGMVTGLCHGCIEPVEWDNPDSNPVDDILKAMKEIRKSVR